MFLERGGKARRIRRHQKTLHLAILIAGPDQRDIGDTAVGNPHFLTIQDPVLAVSLATASHAARITSEVRLSKAKATNHFTAGQARQPVFLLLLRVGNGG